MWLKSEECENIIKKAWNSNNQGEGGWSITQRIAVTSRALSRWNMKNFGNVQRNIKHKMEQLKLYRSSNPTEENTAEEGRILLGGAGCRRASLCSSGQQGLSLLLLLGGLMGLCLRLASFALCLGALALAGSWGEALGGAGGGSGWQGLVLGIWLRLRVALRDNGYHFSLVVCYISLLFGNKCDSGYILDALPII
ncbi:hypothetical protein U1Q18_045030 [Sarracenia purpurea var. burkii]